MICRSCGHLYMRYSKQGICSFCYKHVKEKIFYTVKEWKKFKTGIQEKLLEQHDVILTDHRTRNEKIRGLFRRTEKGKLRREKLKRGFKKFKKLMDQFSTGMNKLHFEGGSDASFSRISGGLNKASGVDHNFNVLFGREDRKIPRL